MAFAILNNIGQIDNLKDAVDQGKVDLSDIDEVDSSFLEKLSGLLESEEVDLESLDGEQLSRLEESIDNLKAIIQEENLDQSEQAALLVLLNQLNLLEIEIPENPEADIQHGSLIALLDNLDQLNVEELMSDFEQSSLEDLSSFKELLSSMESSDLNKLTIQDLMSDLDQSSLEDLSNFKELLSMELSDLDLENLDNDFIKLIQDFTGEKGIDFKLADLESQEAFAARLVEIISGENGNEFLSKIEEEFSAEVRAMEIFAEKNLNKSSINDKLKFESDRIVFETRGAKTELSEMANSKELDLNNILADNSRNLMESENSLLARELKGTSSDGDGEVAKLVSKDLISSELSEEIKLGPDDKIDNLIKAMFADNDQVKVLAENGESQLTGQESFSELIANNFGNSSGTEAIDLGTQASFGLDESVMEQMITEMAQFKQSGSSQMEMELEPPWLGNLKLNVSVEKGEVMAKFLVDNNFVRHELENNIGLLKGSLVKQGFNVEQISIETRDQQAGWQEGDSRNFADDFSDQEYNQDDSGFNFDQEELAYYSENMKDIENIDPENIDPRMRRWLSMKQYYNSMNLLA